MSGIVVAYAGTGGCFTEVLEGAMQRALAEVEALGVGHRDVRAAAVDMASTWR